MLASSLYIVFLQHSSALLTPGLATVAGWVLPFDPGTAGPPSFCPFGHQTLCPVCTTPLNFLVVTGQSHLDSPLDRTFLDHA
ncbi:hypothetical protein C7974DRAFT_406374 [Boeremia exigua]|uniref:uncharacterized protein n=1 Tax=Boeremia exigua TaxID=749465 RepID=UPI001E8D69D7|nr:uncharacterized protein C7974DRAFT_406374 [Boeremia exigua]KAH6611829.1 hypothetical protein C7974DRAFT_406374 [Boeremia exigua]